MNYPDRINLLRSLLNKIISEVTYGDEELIRGVLDRHQKSRRVTSVREKVLKRIRSEIWELSNISSKNWEVVFTSEKPGRLWRPLSYPCIAKVLGGDHSSWVKMSSKISREFQHANTAT